MSDQLPKNRDDARRRADFAGSGRGNVGATAGATSGADGAHDSFVDRWSVLIDCCRPGSNDIFDREFPELAPLAEQIVADPAVQERYKSVQQFDGTLRRALVDAPTPDSLAAKLLANLTAGQKVAESSDDESGDAKLSGKVATISLTQKAITASAVEQRTIRWRSWLAAAAVLMFACSLLYGVFANRDRTIPVAEVVEQSKLWRREIQDDPREWHETGARKQDTRETNLDSFPIDRRIAASPRRYRSLKTTFGQAIVYDLRGARRVNRGRVDGDGANGVGANGHGANGHGADDDRMALLFVVNSDEAFALPSSPPINEPHSRTQGLVIGAWTRSTEKLLYVLVVEGNPNRFRAFVREDRLAHKSPRPQRSPERARRAA